MTEPALPAPPVVDWSALSRRRLGKMRRAARDLFEVLETCAREGRHPVRDVIAAAGDFNCAQHYPSNDVEDPATGCAWYYHAHGAAQAPAWEEHGHFHCFMYTERLSPAARPMALPAHPDFNQGGLVHLAAISFDARGAPARLFIPNRWVTDEWLYPARHIITLLDQFSISSDTRHELTNRFLSAVLRLFHPHIAAALRERDRAIRARNKDNARDFTEEPSIPVTASMALDLDAHLAALDRAWEYAGRRRSTEGVA
ncbi:MAG: hypothetical protein V4858_06990 [Pseudomonadota bacterium]